MLCFWEIKRQKGVFEWKIVFDTTLSVTIKPYFQIFQQCTSPGFWITICRIAPWWVKANNHIAHYLIASMARSNKEYRLCDLTQILKTVMSLKCRTNRSAYKYLNITNFISMIELCLGPNIISFFWSFSYSFFLKHVIDFLWGVCMVVSGDLTWCLVFVFFTPQDFFSKASLGLVWILELIFPDTCCIPHPYGSM